MVSNVAGAGADAHGEAYLLPRACPVSVHGQGMYRAHDSAAGGGLLDVRTGRGDGDEAAFGQGFHKRPGRPIR